MAQWSKLKRDYLDQERTLHEVVVVADRWGHIQNVPFSNAYGTLEVGNKNFYFSSIFQNNTRDDIWDTVIVGSATAVKDPNYDYVNLTVSGNGDSVLRRTKKRIPYFPGRTTQITFAGKFDPTAALGTVQRAGIYDDDNGLFFQIASDGIKLVIRNNGDDSRFVRQEDWNQDKLDGTGPSKTILDPSKFQIAVIEYEWYGGGRVKFGLLVNDTIHWVHYFDNGNVIETSFMGSSVLPLSIELISTGSASVNIQGSSVASLLGELPTKGESVAITNTIGDAITLGDANVFYRCLSVRYQLQYINSISLYNSSSAIGESNSTYQYRVSYLDTFRNNADTLDSDPNTWTWIPVPNSNLEYSIPADLANPERIVTTDGIQIDSNFFFGNNQPSSSVEVDAFTSQMGRLSNGTSDIWTVSIASDSPSKTAYAAIYWTDLVK